MTGLAVFSWFSSMKDISSVSLASLKFVVCIRMYVLLYSQRG